MSAAAGETVLLDANLLVALADMSHVHHAPAVRWFGSTTSAFATCPITQGALLRVLLKLQTVSSATDAAKVLAAFTAHPRHRFWPADVDCVALDWRGVLGHRQVTDACLAALARRHGGKLATFDRGLAALHADVAIQVPATAID